MVDPILATFLLGFKKTIILKLELKHIIYIEMKF